MLHSGGSSQFQSGDHQRFPKQNALLYSMTTVGCYGGSAACVSFFMMLER